MTSKTRKWRNPNDQAEQDARSVKTGISFRGHTSLTSQAEKVNCDLNVLVRRFGVGPLVRPVDQAAFGVYDSELDLRTALETVSSANDAFMALPANVRKRFDNDPLELLAAIQDESKRDELEELGIFKRRDPEPPIARADPAPPAPTPPVT